VVDSGYEKLISQNATNNLDEGISRKARLGFGSHLAYQTHPQVSSRAGSLAVIIYCHFPASFLTFNIGSKLEPPGIHKRTLLAKAIIFLSASLDLAIELKSFINLFKNSNAGIGLLP
jgi:hypothetical protein